MRARLLVASAAYWSQVSAHLALGDWCYVRSSFLWPPANRWPQCSSVVGASCRCLHLERLEDRRLLSVVPLLVEDLNSPDDAYDDVVRLALVEESVFACQDGTSGQAQ
ncbi:MAG: hypothetical protein HQ581_09320 [Planctomycetes bacterium]|nr:hypothetical protein [Planctomycetota bacterium]